MDCAERSVIERPSGPTARPFLGRRVLVTGASGFIGSHLCRRLLELGAEVYGVSRTVRDGAGDGIEWRQADACDAAATLALFRSINPDYAFHLAAHVTGSTAPEQILPTFHANLTGTVNLLAAALETGCVRIVLSGSLSEPEVGQDEMFPTSPYAASKWAGTGYARMFHALYGLPVVIARVFMVYGPDQKDCTKLVPYVISSLLQGKSARLSSGLRQIDWVYVEDVVEGYITLALTPGLEGSTVELGSGRLVSIREIAQRLEGILGTANKVLLGALPDRPLEPVRVARVTETRERTGWMASTPLDEGLRRTVSWYEKHYRDIVRI